MTWLKVQKIRVLIFENVIDWRKNSDINIAVFHIYNKLLLLFVMWTASYVTSVTCEI